MSQSVRPQIVILAGPNGAGKTTAAPRLLQGALRVDEFVNADTIARGLSAFAPEKVAFRAGRIMLARLNELATEGATFAFETTLASRTFAPWIRERRKDEYDVHLIYLVLPSAEHAVERVRDRVRRGGHDVPEATIRRRFVRGLRNLFGLYMSLMTTWRAYDNSSPSLRVLASGGISVETSIHDPIQWMNLQRIAHAPQG